MTYESMQLFDRSNEVWRRLQSLGPAVGPLYELADLKLRVGVPAQHQCRSRPDGRPPSPTSAGDDAGIPDGSTFGISEVTLKTEEDPDARDQITPAGRGESAAGDVDRSHQGEDPGFLLRHRQQRPGGADRRGRELRMGHARARLGRDRHRSARRHLPAPEEDGSAPGSAIESAHGRARFGGKSEAGNAQTRRRGQSAADERKRTAPIPRLYRARLLQGSTAGRPGRSRRGC